MIPKSNYWIKVEKRPLSNVFQCPHCGRKVYDINPVTVHEYKGNQHTTRRVNKCSYPYCPYCRELIFGSEE